MINKNDIIKLEITAISNECSGIARYDGIVIFVPFTAVGDVINARILKVRKNFAYAKIEEILTPSKDRIEPDCSVFTKCGGCTFRHISYEAELEAKRSFIDDAFNRLNKLSLEIPKVIPTEKILEYRNKTQLPVCKNKDGNMIYGFYKTNSHTVVPFEQCYVQPKNFKDIADFVAAEAAELKISIYNEDTKTGVLRHICIRRGHYSNEKNVCLVARRNVPEFKELALRIFDKFSLVKGVVLNINKEDTNVILGGTEIVLTGEKNIIDTMCGNKIVISPKSFYQVNTPSAEILYRIAKEYAEPKGKRILDLYCGVGTIGLSMAAEAAEIIGVEIVPEAIENAVQNAELNDIKNARFLTGDSGEIAEKLLDENSKIDVVILDPPRKGCDIETLKSAVKFNPEKIVMVSCNPITAARDCIALTEMGYEIKALQGVDLFPRTGHVETVVLMSRNI